MSTTILARPATASCDAYDWCENDHTDPEIRDDEHEKHVDVEVGDCSERFLFMLERGQARLEVALTPVEFFKEPGESTNTLVNYAALLLEANAVFEAFEAEVVR